MRRLTQEDFELIELKCADLCALEDELVQAKGTDGEAAAKERLKREIMSLNGLLNGNAEEQAEKRYCVGIPGGGHATFTAPPDERTMAALSDMVELARKNLK